MFIILETCNLGIAATPDGGFLLRVDNIEGFEGNSLGIPVAQEATGAIFEELSKIMGKPKIYTPDDIERTARATGAPTSTS